MNRKTPVKHKVRSHKREGKKVDSYVRGHGSKSIRMAKPTLKQLHYRRTREQEAAVARLKQEYHGHYDELPMYCEIAELIVYTGDNKRLLCRISPNGASVCEPINQQEANDKILGQRYPSLAGLSKREASDVTWAAKSGLGTASGLLAYFEDRHYSPGEQRDLTDRVLSLRKNHPEMC